MRAKLSLLLPFALFVLVLTLATPARAGEKALPTHAEMLDVLAEITVWQNEYVPGEYEAEQFAADFQKACSDRGIYCMRLYFGYTGVSGTVANVIETRYDFSTIIGTSGPVRQMYEHMAQVAATNTTVLVRGESGTGKELIAHAIHYNSPRANKPFVKVSCAALPDSLIESELFGYERGAFTGAEQRKKGRFELAEGGTLFLDEIGDINLATQVKLLRVLQEREFERLGSTETIKVNVRMLTATNKDLERAIAAGTFREDLYFRLNVFTIFVPPLRERKADLLLLVDHFLEKVSREHRKSIKRISTPAIDMLASYHWPGNVRELENTIERAVLVADGDVIHGHHLSPILQTAEATGTVVSGSLAEAVEAFESNLIQDALKTTRGNRARAARLLSTTERIINYKIRRYGIDPRRFRG